MPAADMLTPAPVSKYLLHDVIGQMKAQFDEMANADLVALDIPPIAEPLYERKVLDIVSRIHQAGPQVVLMVRPSMRRKSDRAIWTCCWNRLRGTPFKFQRACSCQVGNGVPGCHVTF